LIFEWNTIKSEENFKKHGVGFAEAELAFEDFYAVEEFDDEHSTAEEARYKMLATAGTKILVVVYAMRAKTFALSRRERRKNMNENSTKDKEAKMRDKEWHLDVSEEQYEEMKAGGLDEESLFKPGRHTFRRRDADKIIKRDNKTIVLRLDEETFDYYQRRAEEKHSASIEEQIEIELRNIAEKEAA
jgi:uncharacterized DUF497 family protein